MSERKIIDNPPDEFSMPARDPSRDAERRKPLVFKRDKTVPFVLYWADLSREDLRTLSSPPESKNGGAHGLEIGTVIGNR